MRQSPWAAVLADLEAHVRDLEAVAANPEELDRFGDGGVPAFVPPTHLGPVPAHLQEQAADLAVRMVAVESSLTAALVRIRQELSATQRLGPGATPSAIYLDTTA